MKKPGLFIFFFLLTGVLYAQSGDPEQRVIYLIRHAKVDMEMPVFCSSAKAEKVNEQYDKSPIFDFDVTRVQNQIDVEDFNVYTSMLPRSIESALMLFPEADTIRASYLFNEYDLPMVSVPLLIMPYKFWTAVSRVNWYLNLNKKGDRLVEKQRMLEATDLLIELARENKELILVAHGLLISDMRRELKKRGWQIVFNGGNKNLAVTKLIYNDEY